MSTLRGRCPECRAYTAVALGDGYECHACGATFAAGLVRVPRAWGAGGEAMARAAALELPYPDTGSVECATLEEQSEALATGLPSRPLVLGGCCCAHVGAIRGLARRGLRVSVVWLDAHGDLNTPESSPSGNAWGMPLRMALDEESARPEDTALVGARSLDPGEVSFMRSTDIDDDVDRALSGADGTYVALDLDVLDPSEIACFMPEPNGLGVDEVASLLSHVAGSATVLGAGLTGLVPESDVATVLRLVRALGL